MKPLYLREEFAHLFVNIFGLVKQILSSNLKKFKNRPEQLKMINNVFKEQLDQLIIEEIPNSNQFRLENPAHSFLLSYACIQIRESDHKIPNRFIC